MNDSRLFAVPGARESGANPLNNSQLAAALIGLLSGEQARSLREAGGFEAS